MATQNETAFGSKFVIKNLDAIVANFHKVHPEVQRELVVLARTNADEFVQRVRERLPTGPSEEHPYSEGFRSEKVKAKFSPTGLVFDIGWWREDFQDEPSGRGIFFAPYPELGTVDQEANPTLEPVMDELAPEYAADIRNVLRRVTRKYSA